ncbi:MAG: hypothetical protein KC501_21475 [Myxococcales bacterium]|nr:hypothetical protein [Myxococcales bacterium]
MLTLTGFRTLADCNVYPDDDDPLTFYTVSGTPTIAKDEAGKPMIWLTWYRRDISELTEAERKTKLGGGLLSLTAELVRTEAQEQEIRDTLSKDPVLHQRLASSGRTHRWWIDEAKEDVKELAKALKLTGLPVLDGTVSIGLLGESSTDEATRGEFVASLIGAGKVSMTGNQRAAFQAKLTQEGAVLLWEAFENNLPAVLVTYDLLFHHRLDGVVVKVTCFAQKAHTLFHEQWEHLEENASFSRKHSPGHTTVSYSHSQRMSAADVLREVASANQFSHVSLEPSVPLDPEVEQSLIDVGNSMLSDFLANAFLDYHPMEATPDELPDVQTQLPEYGGTKYGHDTIDQYSLKDWSQTMTATLNHTFEMKRVLEGRVGPQANLANIFDGFDVAEFRTQLDLEDDWYKYLDVQVMCTTNFTRDPVDLVKVHLKYEESGPLGNQNEVADFVFRADDPGPKHFLSYLADVKKRSYDYQIDVFYRDSDQVYTIEDDTDETVLVLDTDSLGVLKVAVQMGLINWSRIAQIKVDLSYGNGASRKETQMVFDENNQHHEWVEVIGAKVTQAYTYKLTVRTKDDQRIELPEDRSRSGVLVIDSPLRDELEVIVVPAGNFGSGGLLSQVLVALRYTYEDGRVEDAIVSLAKEGDNKKWTVPLVDSSRREYEYQVKVVYSDGVVREDAWRKTDTNVLSVGDAFSVRVEIIPTLLAIPPGRFSFGTLHLRFHDAQDPTYDSETTLTITEFTKPLSWRFRLASPERRSYSYQLTLYDAEGNEHRLEEATEAKNVLVLKPPPRT